MIVLTFTHVIGLWRGSARRVHVSGGSDRPDECVLHICVCVSCVCDWTQRAHVMRMRMMMMMMMLAASGQCVTFYYY